MPNSTQEDLRDVIINEEIGKHETFLGNEEEIMKSIMDRYMEKTVLQLLQWMAKNHVVCGEKNETAEVGFLYKEEVISDKELFENFL